MVRRVWGGVKGVGRGVGGVFSKSASGVVQGYKTVRAGGLGGVAKVPGAVVSGYRQKAAEREAEREKVLDKAGPADAAPLDLPPLDVPTAKLVRLRVRYQPLDESLLAAMEADGSGDGADAVASTTADPGGSKLINGRYASRSTWPSPSSSNGSSNGKRNGSGSTDSMDAYDDELDTLRTVLMEKEREIAGMRTERALMERELAAAKADKEGKLDKVNARLEKSGSASATLAEEVSKLSAEVDLGGCARSCHRRSAKRPTRRAASV